MEHGEFLPVQQASEQWLPGQPLLVLRHLCPQGVAEARGVTEG